MIPLGWVKAGPKGVHVRDFWPRFLVLYPIERIELDPEVKHLEESAFCVILLLLILCQSKLAHGILGRGVHPITLISNDLTDSTANRSSKLASMLACPLGKQAFEQETGETF